MEEAEAHKGKIIWYSTSRGYGFLTDSMSGIDYFFHRTGLLFPEVEATEGLSVVFDVDVFRGKPTAVNINKL